MTDLSISTAKPRSDITERGREAVGRQRDPSDVHRQPDEADGKEAMSNTIGVFTLVDFARVLGGSLAVSWLAARALRPYLQTWARFRDFGLWICPGARKTFTPFRQSSVSHAPILVGVGHFAHVASSTFGDSY